MTRRDQIISEVQSRNGIWDAYDQGRLAFHDRVQLAENPWVLYPGYSHINVSEWARGWEFEAALWIEEHCAERLVP